VARKQKGRLHAVLIRKSKHNLPLEGWSQNCNFAHNFALGILKQRKLSLDPKYFNTYD
jgi:hypothetical protein